MHGSNLMHHKYVSLHIFLPFTFLPIFNILSICILNANLPCSKAEPGIILIVGIRVSLSPNLLLFILPLLLLSQLLHCIISSSQFIGMLIKFFTLLCPAHETQSWRSRLGNLCFGWLFNCLRFVRSLWQRLCFECRGFFFVRSCCLSISCHFILLLGSDMERSIACTIATCTRSIWQWERTKFLL